MLSKEFDISDQLLVIPVISVRRNVRYGYENLEEDEQTKTKKVTETYGGGEAHKKEVEQANIMYRRLYNKIATRCCRTNIGLCKAKNKVEELQKVDELCQSMLTKGSAAWHHVNVDYSLVTIDLTGTNGAALDAIKQSIIDKIDKLLQACRECDIKKIRTAWQETAGIAKILDGENGIAEQVKDIRKETYKWLKKAEKAIYEHGGNIQQAIEATGLPEETLRRFAVLELEDTPQEITEAIEEQQAIQTTVGEAMRDIDNLTEEEILEAIEEGKDSTYRPPDYTEDDIIEAIE